MSAECECAVLRIIALCPHSLSLAGPSTADVTQCGPRAVVAVPYCPSPLGPGALGLDTVEEYSPNTPRLTAPGFSQPGDSAPGCANHLSSDSTDCSIVTLYSFFVTVCE
jgi:hypothetical protein